MHRGSRIRHKTRTRKSPILLTARVYGNATTGESTQSCILTKAEPIGPIASWHARESGCPQSIRAFRLISAIARAACSPPHGPPQPFRFATEPADHAAKPTSEADCSQRTAQKHRQHFHNPSARAVSRDPTRSRNWQPFCSPPLRRPACALVIGGRRENRASFVS